MKQLRISVVLALVAVAAIAQDNVFNVTVRTNPIVHAVEHASSRVNYSGVAYGVGTHNATAGTVDLIVKVGDLPITDEDALDVPSRCFAVTGGICTATGHGGAQPGKHFITRLESGKACFALCDDNAVAFVLVLR